MRKMEKPTACLLLPPPGRKNCFAVCPETNLWVVEQVGLCRKKFSSAAAEHGIMFLKR
jgi:hypothetical protein